jgi:2-keto-3-deoxy-L-rhamnonate aldolase RhmA
LPCAFFGNSSEDAAARVPDVSVRERIVRQYAIAGIDMIAYGHSDLSAQLGVHLDLEHPTFKAAVPRIAAACNAHGKLARGSAETEAQIEKYWQLGCKVLNLPGNDVSTYLDGMKARAGRAHARLKSIGVPTP